MKGQYGEECNITACQKPNSAFWYNHLNHQYYCQSCANRLNNDEFNKRDAQRLLGHEMCTYEGREGKAIVVGLDNLAEKELEAVIREQERGIIITPSTHDTQIYRNLETNETTFNPPLNTMFEITRYKGLEGHSSGRENRRQRRKEQRKKK